MSCASCKVASLGSHLGFLNQLDDICNLPKPIRNQAKSYIASVADDGATR